MNTVNIPVFVISLSSSVHRRKRLQEHFDALGLAFEWFDAVNGKDLPAEEIARLCDTVEIRSKPNWLTRGAIGCALSHYYVYLKIIERNLPYALIFEDDVVLQEDFLPCLYKLGTMLSENEIVSLYYQSWQPVKLNKESGVGVCKKYFLYTPEDIAQPLNAAAYLISNAAARTLASKILPVRFAADAWAEFKKAEAFDRFRCVYPRPVDVVDAKSSIDYIGGNRGAKLLKMIDDYRIFPFYQLLKARRKRSRKQMMKVEIV